MSLKVVTTEKRSPWHFLRWRGEEVEAAKKVYTYTGKVVKVTERQVYSEYHRRWDLCPQDCLVYLEKDGKFQIVRLIDTPPKVISDFLLGKTIKITLIRYPGECGYFYDTDKANLEDVEIIADEAKE